MSQLAARKEKFSAEETEHLRVITLGTLAGGPVIIEEAIKSSNIFDPVHMERAQQLNKQWTDAAALFARLQDTQNA